MFRNHKLAGYALVVGAIAFIVGTYLILQMNTKKDASKKQDDPMVFHNYELIIPDDVPGDIVLRDKFGTETQVNGRILYSDAHREGWAECWNRFNSGGLNLNDRFAEPNYPGEWEIESRGRLAGFEACRAELMRRSKDR